MTSSDFLKELDAFYQELDKLTCQLYSVHGPLLHCGRGCNQCCIDGITVSPVEAAYIEHKCKELIRERWTEMQGLCAFLNEEGECAIYPFRPYVCRTQGLPLRWLEEDEEGGVYEMRDICALNESIGSLESLPEKQCWTLGPFEEKLAIVHLRYFPREMRRIELRDLLKSMRRSLIEA